MRALSGLHSSSDARLLARPQHKTIESVLERGEKLDSLVDKSAALSASSKSFYKTAKKQVSMLSPLSLLRSVFPGSCALAHPRLVPARRTLAASSPRRRTRPRHPACAVTPTSARRRHRRSTPSPSSPSSFLGRLAPAVYLVFALSRRHRSVLFTLVLPGALLLFIPLVHLYLPSSP